VGNIELPETSFSKAIDGFVTFVGLTAAWLWVVLLCIIVMNVTLRYIFDEGRIEFEEIQWHLNAFAFLIAIAYAYRVDAHIRIDLVAVRLTPRMQVWIEIYGTLLLLIPFIVMALIFSFPFVAHSWSLSEVSPSPGGLPFRWFLKGALPGAFGLLGLAVASRLSQLCYFLVRNPA
jgi:TRAP-type mannitol/chloroaromatic compound transport system permease small subunit